MDFPLIPDRIAVNNLVPKKSKDAYDKKYQRFGDWMKNNDIKIINETVLLGYFQGLSGTFTPNSLWTKYSMLKKTLIVNKNIDITKYCKLGLYLKQASKVYKAKKSKILTREDVLKFIREALNECHFTFELVFSDTYGIKQYKEHYVKLLDCLKMYYNSIRGIFFIPLVVTAVSQLIVTLPNGQIKGHELKTFTNRTYNAYQSIPFAEPPVGYLRFQAPLPAQNWSGVLDATNESNVCFQLTTDSVDESEDCLYLNVFTPLLNADKNQTKLPVIFWIFGGGLRDGAARFSYTSPEYWMDEEVIFVTHNYRVGIFGFLSTGDSAIPGNFGLKDQVLALQWAYENIHLFGGDRDRMTIYGVSAGAVSVGYHLLMTQSAGLFRAAIAESGSPLNPYSFRPDPKIYALQLIQSINPNISSNASSEEIRDYLMGLDGRTIDSHSRGPAIAQPGVVIEPESSTAVVTKEMYEMFYSGDFYKVPVLMGINSEESIYIATSSGALVKRGRTYDADPSLLLPDGFPYDPAIDTNTIGDAIKQIYMDQNDTWANRTGRVVRHFSDQRFTRADIMTGKLISQYAPVYFYQFSYDGDLGGWTTIVEDAERVQHAEECKYLFLDKSLDQINVPDGLTHKRLITMWINFVKYGNPTPEPVELLQNIIWPLVSPTDFKYLNINETLDIETTPKAEFFPQWETIFEKYGQRPFSTY